VPRRQTHTRNLDEYSLYPTLNHLIEETILLFHPKVGEGSQSKPHAHRLDARPLVVRQDGPARNSVYFRHVLLHPRKERVELLNFVAFGAAVLQLGAQRRPLPAIFGDCDSELGVQGLGLRIKDFTIVRSRKDHGSEEHVWGVVSE
jgi:hypothetical protein